MTPDLFSPQTPEYFVLYFPTMPNAPYAYCMKVSVNRFTFPSICHSFSLEQVVGQAKRILFIL
jgi:hypothetical protein